MFDSKVLKTNSFFVVSGGHGAGKTTLLQELQKRFFTCIPEVAFPPGGISTRSMTKENKVGKKLLPVLN
jgi:predicted ATPase